MKRVNDDYKVVYEQFLKNFNDSQYSKDREIDLSYDEESEMKSDENYVVEIDDNEQVIDRYRKNQNKEKKSKILKSKKMNEDEDEKKDSFDKNVKKF